MLLIPSADGGNGFTGGEGNIFQRSVSKKPPELTFTSASLEQDEALPHTQ